MMAKSAGIIPLLIAVGLPLTGCRDPILKTQRESFPMVMVAEDFKLSEPSHLWTFRNPGLWKIVADGDRQFLQLSPPSDQPPTTAGPPPLEYALYNPYQFRSFNLSCRLRADQSGCILFGWQDAEHYYALKLAGTGEGGENDILRITGPTSQSLSIFNRPPPLPATLETWRKIDIIRDIDKGTIEVYVDAYEQNQLPWIKVTDRSYKWGHIGLGSATRQAGFAHLLIEGQARKAHMPPPPP